MAKLYRAREQPVRKRKQDGMKRNVSDPRIGRNENASKNPHGGQARQTLQKRQISNVKNTLEGRLGGSVS